MANEMKYCEKIVTVKGDGFQMLGIISLPETEGICKKTALLIITGGFQYRIGSHRQFVRMSRLLAVAGYPSMRFDMPGLGDSAGQMVPFDQAASHIAAAVDTLVNTTGINNVVLWGLCDGASATLLYLQKIQDRRISGLVLLNPWIRSENSLARTHVKYYYRARLLEISFWRKFLEGKIGFKALHDFFGSLRKMRKSLYSSPTSFQNSMAQGWSSCKAPILLLLSENDLTGQEFKEYMEKDLVWRKAVQKNPAIQHVLSNADHTCSQSVFHNQMVQHTKDFLDFVESKNSDFQPA